MLQLFSTDFSKPPCFYDTFALRDSEGHDALQQKKREALAKLSLRTTSLL